MSLYQWFSNRVPWNPQGSNNPNCFNLVAGLSPSFYIGVFRKISLGKRVSTAWIKSRHFTTPVVVSYKTNSLVPSLPGLSHLTLFTKRMVIKWETILLYASSSPSTAPPPQLLCLSTGFTLQNNYLRYNLPKCGTCTPVNIREYLAGACTWHDITLNHMVWNLFTFSNSSTISRLYQESLSLVLFYP